MFLHLLLLFIFFSLSDLKYQVYTIGLKQGGYAAADLLSSGTKSKQLKHITIVWRDRQEPETRVQHLTESECIHSDDVVVSAARGYYIVSPGESVLFLSRRAPGMPLFSTKLYFSHLLFRQFNLC